MPKFTKGEKVIVVKKISNANPAYAAIGKTGTVVEPSIGGADVEFSKGKCFFMTDEEIELVKSNKFKVRDRVKNKFGQVATIIGLPGMDEYDSYHFGFSEQGCRTKLENGGTTWDFQKDLIKIEEKEMKKTFTNSQKIRLRLKVYFDKNVTEYDDFEEFYTDFTNAVLSNIEFLAGMFLK